MQGLKDIKGLMSIEDYSWIFALIVLFIVAFLIFILIKKFLARKKSQTPLQIAKERLKDLHVKSSKEVAYTLSEVLGVIDETKEFEEFVNSLEKYKYKKEVAPLSEEEKMKIAQIKEKYGV